MLYMASVLIMISSIDDMFIDIYYWTRRIYREFTVYRRFGHLTVEQLREQAEKPLAIMIPAWQEAPVIAKMIENAISTFEYSNYVIFAGTYPNDPETGREVEFVRERFTNVERVVTPHDGPTSKADCLNWVIQAIKLYEQENGIEFAGIVMHDAEDVVHPLEMRLFNHLIGRFDFIQLPVYPLESRWWRMTSGHYMDEFAKNHGKDLVVREKPVLQRFLCRRGGLFQCQHDQYRGGGQRQSGVRHQQRDRRLPVQLPYAPAGPDQADFRAFRHRADGATQTVAVHEAARYARA